MTTKWNELNIKEKLQLIDEKEKQKISERKLAVKYKISKSQVHRILENKEKIKKVEKNRSGLKRQRINREF